MDAAQVDLLSRIAARFGEHTEDDDEDELSEALAAVEDFLDEAGIELAASELVEEDLDEDEYMEALEALDAYFEDEIELPELDLDEATKKKLKPGFKMVFGKLVKAGKKTLGKLVKKGKKAFGMGKKAAPKKAGRKVVLKKKKKVVLKKRKFSQASNDAHNAKMRARLMKNTKKTQDREAAKAKKDSDRAWKKAGA